MKQRLLSKNFNSHEALTRFVNESVPRDSIEAITSDSYAYTLFYWEWY